MPGLCCLEILAYNIVGLFREIFPDVIIQQLQIDTQKTTNNTNRHNIRINLVYCGSGVSGKTTTLCAIHSQIDPDHKGTIMIQEVSESARYLFFDFIKPGGLPRKSW